MPIILNMIHYIISLIPVNITAIYNSSLYLISMKYSLSFQVIKRIQINTFPGSALNSVTTFTITSYIKTKINKFC